MINVDFRFGLMLPMIALLSFGCPNSANNSFSSNHTNNDNGNASSNENSQNYLDITGFSFVLNPSKMRLSYAVHVTVVGTLKKVEGGTPPYFFQFISGDVINDIGNKSFTINKNNVLINDSKLNSNTYHILSYSKPLNTTVYPDPLQRNRIYAI